MKLHRSFYVWIALSLLVLLSWLCAESPLLLGVLAIAKFLGIFWVFMEMWQAHRFWLALACVYLTIWFAALLLL